MKTTPSTKRFRENGILIIDVAAEFYPWTEQRQTGLRLLPGNVEQQTGVVPSVLGITKVMVNLLQLTVLL
jgi:hypothetical protein